MNFFDKNLKISGDILARTLQFAKKKLKIGIKTIELDSLIEKFIYKNNAKPVFKGYKNYQYASCISINDILVHGIPSEYKISQGDVVSIDIGVKYKNAITDGAITIAIDPIPEYIIEAIKSTQLALKEGIKQCVAGNQINNISKAIEKVARKNNLGIIKELSGHGTGKKIHLPPTILNYFKSQNNEIIKEGMILAIEPMFSASLDKSDPTIKLMQDKWSVSLPKNNIGIHFEHTILVTKEKPTVLTKLIDTDKPLW